MESQLTLLLFLPVTTNAVRLKELFSKTLCLSRLHT